MIGGTLVFVAGASPQIITETIYCLRDEHREDIDVRVLTTARGREGIERDLFRREGGPRLQKAYPKTRRFRLVRGGVAVLRDSRGNPLEDVRSRSDNLADPVRSERTIPR